MSAAAFSVWRSFSHDTSRRRWRSRRRTPMRVRTAWECKELFLAEQPLLDQVAACGNNGSFNPFGPRPQLACGVAGLVQFIGRTPGRDEKHGRQPLWLLDVSHNLRPRHRRLDPSRTGRARRRRNVLERDSAAEAGTNFRLPRRRGRGAGTRDARRRQRFQRSRAHARIWRRLARRQRRRGLFLEQSRSAALSPGCGPAAEPDHACSNRRRSRCAAIRGWRHRPPQGTNGLRPGGSHRVRGGDHHAGWRRPLRRDRPQVLVSGNDFYSTPRLSPDGNRMCWLTWRHPNMPWVTTEAWIGDILPDGTIGNARRVAGGQDESVFQPEWSPDGDLYFVSDRVSGWWNLYRERDGAIEPMAEMDAEFGRPQWQFGMSTYAFESAHRLIACFVRDGVWTLAGIDTRSKRFEVIPTEFTDIAQLRAAPGRVVFIGGSPSEAPALVDLDLNTGTHRALRRSFVLREDVRRYVSIPQPIAFPTGGGETAHAFYYPPSSPEFAAPADEKSPVLVKSHGGPTSAASSTLSLSTQYWTSRGIGVLDVNYRGSTGYGRAYRLRLERQWGVVDVEDCV